MLMAVAFMKGCGSLHNDDTGTISANMMRWALDHPQEWEIVIGFEKAGAQRNLEIQQMLKEAGFPELSEMLAIRVYRLLSGENS